MDSSLGSGGLALGDFGLSYLILEDNESSFLSYNEFFLSKEFNEFTLLRDEWRSDCAYCEVWWPSLLVFLESI